MLRRRRASAVCMAAPGAVIASGSSKTKAADLPDSAVIVAMPADLANVDAIVADVVAVPRVV